MSHCGLSPSGPLATRSPSFTHSPQNPLQLVVLKGVHWPFKSWAWALLAFARSPGAVWDLHTDLHTVIMINNSAAPWQTGEEFREGLGTAPTSLLPSLGEELIFSQLL